MAVVNLKKRQIECKIVYYGPARCGKTTNLEYIHKAFSQHVKGQMISIDTEGDRTLFFDFLPLELGKVKGCDVRVQLYTVPDRSAIPPPASWSLEALTGWSLLPIRWRSAGSRTCWP